MNAQEFIQRNPTTRGPSFEQAQAYMALRKMALRLERLKSGASMHQTAAGHENGDPQAPMTRRERNAKKSLRAQQKASRRANRG